MPQGSIFGPLLLNIFINIFLYREKFYLCNGADDNTLYTAEKSISIITLMKMAKQVGMKLNLHKTHCATYKSVFAVMF